MNFGLGKVDQSEASNDDPCLVFSLGFKNVGMSGLCQNRGVSDVKLVNGESTQDFTDRRSVYGP